MQYQLAKDTERSKSMEVIKRDVRGLLHTADQFVIPMFQRYYVWKQRNWRRLWEDITQVMTLPPERKHFMGSLVCLQVQGQPGVVPQYLVIDGQQRLTMIGILLCAIRDEAEKFAGEQTKAIAQQIQNHYIIDAFRKGYERYKILPRTRDRDSLFDLFDSKQVTKGSTVQLAYDFFRKQIAGAEPLEERIANIFETVTTRLSFVTITLVDENPFEIFETLNAEGVPLLEADLVRNYVFLKVGLQDQDAFEASHWKPFEALFEVEGEEAAVSVTEFYRDFLMRKGVYVRKSEVYEAFKREVDSLQLNPQELLKLLSRYARMYLYIRRPRTAPPLLRKELKRLHRLGMTTANPLILHFLDLNAEGAVTDDAVITCIKAIESFIIRRSITGQRTRGYGDQFPAAIPVLDTAAIVHSLAVYLDKIGWPSNEVFVKELQVFSIYTRESNIAQLILLGIEESEGHKEAVDVDGLLDKKKIQIEHVMPQTISDDEKGDSWKEMLGPNWKIIHEKMIHVIGNLSLSGYNAELSNEPFDHKKNEFVSSNLLLNKYFVNIDIWDQKAIEKRGEKLANDASLLWPSSAAFLFVKQVF
jgi:hypothetical protein